MLLFLNVNFPCLSIPVNAKFNYVCLQVSSVRFSKFDDKRLSVFTGTKTLHLRCVSREDRAMWIKALQCVKDLFPRALTSSDLATPEDIVVSTQNLRSRLSQEGIDEEIINDCESIIIRRYSLLVYLLIITVTISFTVARVELGKQKQRKLQCNT